MKFKTLQNNLRKLLWERIEARELTGLGLAEQTGFKQAHISNFLNRKRGLSVAGMDTVLSVQRLSILDLFDPAALSRRMGAEAGEEESEIVPLVDGRSAAQPHIPNAKVREVVKFKKDFLGRLRRQMEGRRTDWQRFVLVRPSADDARSMHPRLAPGAQLLVDRHYNSLQPYRKGEPNLYVVNQDGRSTVRYVELAGRQLVLRSHNPGHPVEVLTMKTGKKAGEYLIGRVCHVAMEV